MASFNQVILAGNLGQDPEFKRLQNGGAVANMSIATSEKWKDRDGNPQEKTQWHRIVVWGGKDSDGLAGVVEKFLRKGDQVMVVGQLETREWKDDKGDRRFATEVVLKGMKAQLQILKCKAWENGNGGSAKSSSSSAKAGAAQSRQEDMDDEIPF